MRGSFAQAKSTVASGAPDALERLITTARRHDVLLDEQMIGMGRLVEHYYPGTEWYINNQLAENNILDLIVVNRRGRQLLVVHIAQEKHNMMFITQAHPVIPIESKLTVIVQQNPENSAPWSKTINCTVKYDLGKKAISASLPEGRGMNVRPRGAGSLDDTYVKLAEFYEQRLGFTQEQLYEITRAVQTGMNRCGYKPIQRIYLPPKPAWAR